MISKAQGNLHSLARKRIALDKTKIEVCEPSKGSNRTAGSGLIRLQNSVREISNFFRTFFARFRKIRIFCSFACDYSFLRVAGIRGFSWGLVDTYGFYGSDCGYPQIFPELPRYCGYLPIWENSPT